MSTHIIKLMDILIIYLISTFVHGFVFKAKYLLLGFYNSSLHNLIIHYTYIEIEVLSYTDIYIIPT